MLAYVIMFVVMFTIKCVTLTFGKNKESTVVSTFLSGTNQIFLNTIVWFLRLTAMFQFYLLVVDNNLTVIPIIVGFILPNVLFWFKGIKASLSDLLVRWLKSFIGHKYRTCPFCHESHLFFRYTEDRTATYYYLLTEDDSLVAIGDFDNSDHPARFFLSNDESHFDGLVDTMLPYMLPGMEEVVYVGGRQQRLARELYCVDCQERVSEDSGVQFGEVLLSEHRHEDHKALV